MSRPNVPLHAIRIVGNLVGHFLLLDHRRRHHDSQLYESAQHEDSHPRNSTSSATTLLEEQLRQRSANALPSFGVATSSPLRMMSSVGPGRCPLPPSRPVLPDPAFRCSNLNDMFGTVCHGSLSFGKESVTHARGIGGARTGQRPVRTDGRGIPCRLSFLGLPLGPS